MELVELSINGFRNLEEATFTFTGGSNLVLGPNGAGKTSLLEAIGVLGNLRSFRAATLRPVIQHGVGAFRLTGRIVDGTISRRLEVVVEAGPPLKRKVFVNGGATKVANYLLFFPVFTITGPDRELVRGAPTERRALLDRFIFLQQPRHLDKLRNYRRALAQRNAALCADMAAPEMEVWNDRLATAAAAVVVARQENAGVLSQRFSEVYQAIGGDGLAKVEIAYRGEPWLSLEEAPEKVEDLYRQRYNETRERDRRAGFTGEGPHRHDVSLRTAGRAIRNVSSTGQSKMVAAALRLATLAQVEKEKNQPYPVVVDDVDAELDGEGLRRLLEYLQGDRQTFLSSTDESLKIKGTSSTQRITLENGEHRR